MDIDVCVLLSSYNGEKYIREQINSILSQSGVNIKLLIRDDGSSDSTAKIIEEYAKNDERVRVLVGNNLGFANSFYELIKLSPDADYYAFSDQDDIWFKDKLYETIAGLKKNNCDAAFCNAFLTDEYLNKKRLLYGENYKLKNKFTCFDDTIAHGCLLVFSKKIKDIVLNYKGRIPISHDTWVCAVCTFCGSISFIPTPLSLYRRHFSATSIEKKHEYNKAQESVGIFLESYRRFLKEKDISYLTHVLRYKTNIWDKVCLLLSLHTRRDSFVDTIKLKAKILLNKY